MKVHRPSCQRAPLRPMASRGTRGLLLLVMACSIACEGKKELPAPPSSDAPPPSLLVSAKTLKAEPKRGILLLDVRPAELYRAGCLPDARNLPTNLTFNPHAKDFKLAPLMELEDLIGAAGVNLKVPVVIYGEGKFRDAARMFWILEMHGHRSVRLLDGGVPAWEAEGGRLVPPPARQDKSSFLAQIRPQALATKLAVRKAIDDAQVILVDCRPGDEFRGEKSVTPRTGRIPSAINVVWTDNLVGFEQEPVVRLKNKADLARLYPESGEGQRFLVYCNKGKQSAVAYFSLRHLGRKVAAYDGSWWEWSQDMSLPIER